MSVHQQQINSDAECFRELHEKYGVRLLNSLTTIVKDRETAEDITSAAFAAAFEKRASFRGESSFYTWIHAIAFNEARGAWRKNKGASFESIDALDSEELTEPGLLEQTLEQSERCLRVRQALRRIPAVYRRMLVSHFVRRLSVKQIARLERVPVGTVLSRIFAGKRILRHALETAP